MIAFVDGEFLSCVAIGVVAGGTVAALVAGIRAVIRFVMRTIHKA